MAPRAPKPAPRFLNVLLLLISGGLGAACGNTAPVLQPVASPQTAFVGTRLEITLLAYDADGDKLTFAYRTTGPSLGSRARIVPLVDRAIFSWTPGANDVGEHHIDFTASDGKTSDTQTVTVNVKPGTTTATAPLFRRPLGFGTTLDLGKEACVDVDILVEDPDTLSVRISQEPTIEGSTLTSVGGLAALFHWCPDESQQKQLQHLLRLWADDGDNPPVSKDFMIVLHTPLPQQCPGQPPQIVHSAPAAVTTNDELALEATVTDDKGLKAAPVVYHSTSAPADPNNIDLSTLQQIEMTQKSPGFYQASLPNPVKGLAPGSKRTLYYLIVAEDDDDTAGPCDHRTQAPQTGTYQVEVTAPAAAKSCTSSKGCPVNQVCDVSICVSDSCTPQDTNGDKIYWEQAGCPANHFCPAAGPQVAPSHCAADCTKDADCATGRSCKVFDTAGGCAVAGTRAVGDGCTSYQDCAKRTMCLPWSGGYCSLSDCDSTGSYSGPCPAGAVCYPSPDLRFTEEFHWICVRRCTSDNECRKAEGYTCQQIQDDQKATAKVCLPKVN